MPIFNITISRTCYETFTVEADTEENAIDKAYDKAYNMNWSAKNADYKTEEIIQKDDKVETPEYPYFEFPIATDVTTLAHSLNKEYDNARYGKIFIIPDTKNIWLLRVLPNRNEEYNIENGKFLIERDRLDYDSFGVINLKGLNENKDVVKEILTNDTMENWDVKECDSEDEVLDSISGGFGIIGEDGVKYHPEK